MSGASVRYESGSSAFVPSFAGGLRGDQGDLLISIHGQSVQESSPGERRAILARVELTAEGERYCWLNTCSLVGESEIDEEREDWWLDTYMCVNELAQAPPAWVRNRPSGSGSLARPDRVANDHPSSNRARRASRTTDPCAWTRGSAPAE